MNLHLDLDAMPPSLRETRALRFEHHVHLNWRPHIPAVDEQLLVTIAQQHGGMLTTETFDAAGCGFRGTNGRDGARCGASYGAHVCSTVALLRLKRSVRESEVAEIVHAARAWLRENGVDGVGLLPSNEGFLVLDKDGIASREYHLGGWFQW